MNWFLMVKGVPTTWDLVNVDDDAYPMARLTVAISVGRWFQISFEMGRIARPKSG